MSPQRMTSESDLSGRLHPDLLALHQAFHGIERIAEVFARHDIPVLKIEPSTREDQRREFDHVVVLVKDGFETTYHTFDELNDDRSSEIGYDVMFEVQSKTLYPETVEENEMVQIHLCYHTRSKNGVGGYLDIDEGGHIGENFLRCLLGMTRRDFDLLTSSDYKLSQIDETRFFILLEIFVKAFAQFIKHYQTLPQTEE